MRYLSKQTSSVQGIQTFKKQPCPKFQSFWQNENPCRGTHSREHVSNIFRNSPYSIPTHFYTQIRMLIQNMMKTTNLIRQTHTHAIDRSGAKKCYDGGMLLLMNKFASCMTAAFSWQSKGRGPFIQITLDGIALLPVQKQSLG